MSANESSSLQTGEPARVVAAQAPAARALLATVVATVVLAGSAAVHDAHVLVVGVAVVQAALIVGWVIGTVMPGRIGGMLLAVAGCAAADGSVVAWPTSELSPLLAPLGLAILALFIHQLTRGVVRSRVVESLSGIVVVLVGGVALTALVQLRHEFGGREMAIGAVVAAGAAVAVGMAVDLVWPRPRLDPAVPRGLLGLAAGIVAGALLGRLGLGDTDLDGTRALGVCAIVALLAALAGVGTTFVSHGLATQDAEPVSEFAVVHRPRPSLRPVIEAILPIALVAPAAYVLFLSAT